ncbi:uncharacterized protein RJT21DRAFT_118010 [Scheffersomyces amazonensis]|uniref:uncharacterized protein n=1 Tax=Scheffersomyces amazonensis TaxID=1078765 RepID=UPI00315D62AF
MDDSEMEDAQMNDPVIERHQHILDELINFETAVEILTEHFEKGDTVDIFEIHRAGNSSYEQQKQNLNDYLTQADDTYLEPFLRKYDVSDGLLSKHTKKECIKLLFELHNFHRLDCLQFPLSSRISELLRSIKSNIYTATSNLKFRNYFESYADLSMFLRFELNEVNIKESKNIRYYRMKSLVGNFIPVSTTWINYEVPTDLTFRITTSKLGYCSILPDNLEDENRIISEQYAKSNFIKNIIKPLLNILNLSLEEDISSITGPYYSINKARKPDITIRYDGHDRLPIQVKKFSNRDYFNTKSEPEVGLEPGIELIETFSSVLYHCLSLKSFVGILSNCNDMIAIDFSDSILSNEFYKLDDEPRILRNISCRMYKLTNILQMLFFIKNFIESPQRLDQVLVKSLKIIGNKKKMVVNSLHRNLNRRFPQLLNETPPPSRMDINNKHLALQPSNGLNVLADEAMYDLFGSANLNITKLIHNMPRTPQMTCFNVLLNNIKWIEIFAGAKFGSSDSIVVKVQTKSQTEDILKIFDPIRSETLTYANGDTIRSLGICFNNFVKELLSLYQLREHDFVPKVSEIGIIYSNDSKYEYQLTITNNNVTGFYFNYAFIKGIPFGELTYLQRYSFKKTLNSIVGKMHDTGVVHLNLNENNIIVEDLASKKIKIVGFSSSMLQRTGTSYWPYAPYARYKRYNKCVNFKKLKEMDCADVRKLLSKREFKRSNKKKSNRTHPLNTY